MNWLSLIVQKMTHAVQMTAKPNDYK